MPPLAILGLISTALDLVDKLEPIISNINIGDISIEEQQELKTKLDAIRKRIADKLPRGPEWDIRPE